MEWDWQQRLFTGFCFPSNLPENHKNGTLMTQKDTDKSRFSPDESTLFNVLFLR